MHLNERPMRGQQSWWKAVSIPANDILKSYAVTVSKEVEKYQKQEPSLPAKQQCKKSRQASTENTSTSQRSYSCYDCRPNATNVLVDIPVHHFQDLIVSFYKF